MPTSLEKSGHSFLEFFCNYSGCGGEFDLLFNGQLYDGHFSRYAMGTGKQMQEPPYIKQLFDKQKYNPEWPKKLHFQENTNLNPDASPMKQRGFLYITYALGDYVPGAFFIQDKFFHLVVWPDSLEVSRDIVLRDLAEGRDQIPICNPPEATVKVNPALLAATPVVGSVQALIFKRPIRENQSPADQQENLLSSEVAEMLAELDPGFAQINRKYYKLPAMIKPRSQLSLFITNLLTRYVHPLPK